MVHIIIKADDITNHSFFRGLFFIPFKQYLCHISTFQHCCKAIIKTEVVFDGDIFRPAESICYYDEYLHHNSDHIQCLVKSCSQSKKWSFSKMPQVGRKAWHSASGASCGAPDFNSTLSIWSFTISTTYLLFLFFVYPEHTYLYNL